MSLAELLKKSREASGITAQELADRVKIPVAFLKYLEEPEQHTEEIIAILSEGLQIMPQVFKGLTPPKPKEPTPEEKKAAALKDARFPHIRRFLFDPARCENPDTALAQLSGQPLSLIEKNVILYLSTTALYHFCDTNTSGFAFDEYLFKLHAPLLARLEKELAGSAISAEEKEERLSNARGNVFACDSIENIAIRVVEPFAVEMEQKLAAGAYDFKDDLNLPFTWNIDETLMKIEIKGSDGLVRDTLKLLDVKKRDG